MSSPVLPYVELNLIKNYSLQHEDPEQIQNLSYENKMNMKN